MEFVEYVVAEVKSKRLSKTNAIALVREFSYGSKNLAGVSLLHPLLHRNTSDLTAQRYSSTFTGEEFFFADHQVALKDRAAEKMLPGVAYLEMARMAIEEAWPRQEDAARLEMRDIIWAKPIVISENNKVNITLSLSDSGQGLDQIDFETYTQEGDRETVHCLGSARWSRDVASIHLDVKRIRERMTQGQLEPGVLYDACGDVGLRYGRGFRAITSVQLGTNEVLAELEMPSSVLDTMADYVLHPSLMDGALQAAMGLVSASPLNFHKAFVPFALQALRIASPCTKDMIAWVRYSPGSQVSDQLVKLDVDLCDDRGITCVQMHGFSMRVLSREVIPPSAGEQATSSEASSDSYTREGMEVPGSENSRDGESLAEKTELYLRRQFADLLKLPSHKIDAQARLEVYGMDSILAMQLTGQLEKTFGPLSKTLFFEYQTLRELSVYLVQAQGERLAALFAPRESQGVRGLPLPGLPAEVAGRPKRRFIRSSGGVASAAASPVAAAEAIAIVGLSGRYPESVDLEAYWSNLRSGRDCIVEVPRERWDWREYFTEDRSRTGHHYSKWGGFIAGVDEFDPLFFNISPREAKHIDPQERLFLQHAWMAVEDAGYTRASLQRLSADSELAGEVGVYVGLMYSEYQLFGAEASLRGDRLGIAGSPASIANRVSYVLNLHGPSMTLDTMCSSSLSAIHLACQDLRQGRTGMALAGGVNVSIHPNKYLLLSAGQFISSDGHCQSFGEGGDGYIPGEGVGVVVLKRASDAERDGDHIYGLIRGSALTHGGKTNGYTVPNPQAQSGAIGRALAEARLDARHLSYIEAHGTGTRLGDPIEIAALAKAFRAYTADTGFCLIGSAKSNIGHCESAAGVAGLTKVLLQMQHGEIVPSLHSGQLNPHIDFASTPFVVNQELRAWEAPVVEGEILPRIAGISSFGAGGSNAHLIVQQVLPPAAAVDPETEAVVLLSARTVEQLQQKASDLLAFVQARPGTVSLAAMAYTLQVGREAMEERLGLVVRSMSQVVDKLAAYGQGKTEIEDLYRGQVRPNQEALALFRTDADLQQTVAKWMANRQLPRLLEMWVKGLDLDWSQMYGAHPPPRLSLPVYPFARDRYWVDPAPHEPATPSGVTPVLHPLLHCNLSNLDEQRYSSTFTGKEFFLQDHQLKRNGQPAQTVLPAVAYLEMARAAIEQALPGRTEMLELHSTVWAQPFVVREPRQIRIALLSREGDGVEFEIYSGGEDAIEVVHCQGRGVWHGEPVRSSVDVDGLKRQMTQGQSQASEVYGACAELGLLYGPTFQSITQLYRGNGQVLAQLRLPDGAERTFAAYGLHPSLLDGALQAAVGLLDGASGSGSGELRLPFSLDRLSVVSPCTPEMWAWVRLCPGSQATDRVVKLDIDLYDNHGNLCTHMHGFSSRVAGQEIRAAEASLQRGVFLGTPVWEGCGGLLGEGGVASYHVLGCGLGEVGVGLEALLGSVAVGLLEASAEGGVGARYGGYALGCFERIRILLQSRPMGRVWLQVVVSGEEEGGESGLLAGLQGLLKTASLENPQLVCQLLLVPAAVRVEDLAGYLEQERMWRPETLVRYGRAGREVLRWQEVGAERAGGGVVFQDRGVYLITGGLGGLGVLFAREILSQTGHGQVVLTGRAAGSAAIQSRLAWVAGEGSGALSRLSYRQVDLGDREQVEQLVAGVEREHGRLDGILHSAGMIADNFLLKKSSAEFVQVMLPKVLGTCHLDEASRHVALDFFVLFSSLAGALGNVGQSDYATANGFLDRFASWRNEQVGSGRRQGRTRSINWPLWQDGGMQMEPSTQAMLEASTGMRPMSTATGMRMFYRSLALPYAQLLVATGELASLRRLLLATPSAAVEPPAAAAVPVARDGESLAEKTELYLRRQFADLLKLPSHKIDAQARLEVYGMDSILAMQLTGQLEKTFGPLSKTLFFEYQTLRELSVFFTQTHSATMREQTRLSYEHPKAEGEARTSVEPRQPKAKPRKATSLLAIKSKPRTDIAIIGVGGRYPKAQNLQEFWENLRNGRDCITEIPSDRWDNTLYYDPDPQLGKSYSKWGGFLSDVDKFDPLFFNMSPKEAAMVDPQERLFLETAWQTIEDAGYSKLSMAGKRVGVYVGVMWGHYELFGAESILNGHTAIPSSSHASIANRVSYFFDLHGPSIALDTMCSSSMTAIHLACEELRNGDIEAAIAGGVNATIHPYKYLTLSQGRFLSSDGKCRSFGKGGDGYVPGEGVGSILMKRLEDALQDGDQIYAVIKASSLNHGGKTNGYTVPNPNAQAELISAALKQADVGADTIDYVETHGTGTSLGDPIEISGLMKAFGGFTGRRQYCPIGSVKSNIGHLEAAAGIAAVTKILLQIRHEQLVPSLHAPPLNPNIPFQDSPFYVQTKLTKWKRSTEHPRRAGVSAFGAGGSNAHLILEEHLDTTRGKHAELGMPLKAFVLSAADRNALRRYAESFIMFLHAAPNVSLADLAYTLQVGRTPLDARLLIITSSPEDLTAKLHQWMAFPTNADKSQQRHLPELENIFEGDLKQFNSGVSSLIHGNSGKAFLESLLANHDLEKIAGLWILGVDIDWSLLNPRADSKRISLPTYPFTKELCWIHNETPFPPSTRGLKNLPIFSSEPQEQKQRMYYHNEWTLTALGASRDSRDAIGPLLVLNTSEELFRAITKLAEQHVHCAPITFVKPGIVFEEIQPNVYSIDLTRGEQFQQLVDHLSKLGQLPKIILHGHTETCDLPNASRVTRQLDQGIYSIFYLTKALLKEQHQGSIKIVSAFSTDSETTDPLATALGGFLETLSLENPHYMAKVIQVDRVLKSHDALSPAGMAGLIWREAHEEVWNTRDIQYQSQFESGEATYERFGRKLHLRTLTRSNSSPSLFRINGVYLITGGLGGLGLIVGEYLAIHFQAKLVLVSRSIPNQKQQQSIDKLQACGAEVLSLQADVSEMHDVERVLTEAKIRFVEVHGVIHAAGVHRDAFILRKTKQEMEAVLAPKVFGTLNLDIVTREEPLDFFVLFSSVTGIVGNSGQSDYAFGNRFLDCFAERRDILRKGLKRSGRTLSISWPLWEDGGMGGPPESRVLVENLTGIYPLPTQEGLQCFRDLLSSEWVQAVALYGNPSRTAAHLAKRLKMGENSNLMQVEPCEPLDLLDKTELYLKILLGQELGLTPERIGSTDRLESFGIDSVTITRFNANLEKNLGGLPKTLLYEHETVREIARYLTRETRQALIVLLYSNESAEVPKMAKSAFCRMTTQDTTAEPMQKEVNEPVAIIGIHGQYPHSADLQEFWNNLQLGREMIDVVPPNRWNYRDFHDADPGAASDGKIYCKWGGFLQDCDKFDADFFHISAEEAKLIDPQERLFLESAWAALEDAGYTRSSLKTRFPKATSANVGVFVGVTTNSYSLRGPEEKRRGNHACPSAMPWSIANRVSYFFNFSGPSMPVDTACSSSLVAVHLACESLRTGGCQVALAGGVNLYLHPSKYQSLCQRRMLALGGRTHSYGAGDDGFVPGEAIGTLVLKPLSKAIADHDRIHAVILASDSDHAGRSNGYAVPNPNAQADLITRTFQKARIQPDTIGYVEGHGTGTLLGDSIEIAALTKAFESQTKIKQFCPIGSVKANIGHSESAAGLASLTKVILQMRHHQLVPSLNSEQVNPNLNLERSPFYLQHGLSLWNRPSAQPRRALINAFGAGGVNACVILEEYEPLCCSRDQQRSTPCLFVLSAHNEDRLREYVKRVLSYLKNERHTDLSSLCYTLQVGREAMDKRLAFVVCEADLLIELLTDLQADGWNKLASAPNVFHRSSNLQGGPKSQRPEGADEQRILDLATAWAAGAEVDWNALYPGDKPSLVSLPHYPFDRIKHWISESAPLEKGDIQDAQIHPFISANSSTLQEVSFSSSLSPAAFYSVDHRVNHKCIFPGAGLLEIACIAGAIAGERSVRKIEDVVWIQPVSFEKGTQTLRTSLRQEGKQVRYVISSFDKENEIVVHSEGRLTFSADHSESINDNGRLPLQELKAQCTRFEGKDTFYRALAHHGLDYGPSFRTVQEIFVCGSFALSLLHTAPSSESEFDQFILHPTVIDGALQTAAGLLGSVHGRAPYVPFALERLDILRPLRRHCYAYVEFAKSNVKQHSGIQKFKIWLLDESGNVMVVFHNLCVRVLIKEQSEHRLPPASEAVIVSAV